MASSLTNTGDGTQGIIASSSYGTAHSAGFQMVSWLTAWLTFMSHYFLPVVGDSRNTSWRSLAMRHKAIKGLVHPKMKNAVINYSPSCCSKPVRPRSFSEHKIKIFLMESERSRPSIDSEGPYTIKVQKRSKEISKNNPCDIRGSTVILRSYKNTFCMQRKQK